jgi:hypothetical protein
MWLQKHPFAMGDTDNLAHMVITVGVFTVFGPSAKTIVSDFAPIGKTVVKIGVHPC